MFKILKSSERGHTKISWLISYHSFSFGEYYNPSNIRFRVLRVMNDDRIAPGYGFGTHPHDNMEILSYVAEGELEHKDSMGNGSVIRAGEFQLMSAGRGVTHSEFNPSTANSTHLYQIWIFPDKKDLEPSYQQKDFLHELQSSPDEMLKLVVSPDGEGGSLRIHQDVKIYLVAPKKPDTSFIAPVLKERYGWLQVVSGEYLLQGEPLSAGDGVAIEHESKLQVEVVEPGQLLAFDLP